MKSEKQLYQWDVNQYLIELQPTAEFVDYTMGNEAIRIKADGTRCRIPDEVLQTYKLEKLYAIIDKENFEPGGTLEERVTVLEEVLQEQVMAVTTAKEDD